MKHCIRHQTASCISNPTEICIFRDERMRRHDDVNKAFGFPIGMDIYCETPSLVEFAFPDAGYDHEKADTAKLLRVGGVYTVERKEVSDFSTDVYLREFPNHRFNSVFFRSV